MLSTLGGAVEVAREYLADLEPRWSHFRAVGVRAEGLCRDHDLPDELAAAAWLHDLGYAAEVAATGFHPLDGARYLRRLGAPASVMSLVAYHSGAIFEAKERGLVSDLAKFAPPNPELLDILVIVDMTTSSMGKPISVEERLADIIDRYEASDPVYRAVSRSAPVLRKSAARAAGRLPLSDVCSVPIL